MPGVTSGSSLSMTSCEQWNRTSALLGAASINAMILLHHIFPALSEKRGVDVDRNDETASFGTKPHAHART
jgi:hypothetical protein